MYHQPTADDNSVVRSSRHRRGECSAPILRPPAAAPPRTFSPAAAPPAAVPRGAAAIARAGGALTNGAGHFYAERVAVEAVAVALSDCVISVPATSHRHTCRYLFLNVWLCALVESERSRWAIN